MENGVQSFEEPLELLSPEAIAAATPCEISRPGP